MNSVIKLYSPQSELSNIADEIFDLRNNVKSLKIELRDKISLNRGEAYELKISRGEILRFRIIFIYLDSNLIRIPIYHEDEIKILSLTSKKPFEIKILDKENNCLGQGLFYRYKTRNRTKRSTNPREWDINFHPERHLNYEDEFNGINSLRVDLTDTKLNEDKKLLNDILSNNLYEQNVLISNSNKFCSNSKHFQEFLSFFFKFTILYILFDFLKTVLKIA